MESSNWLQKTEKSWDSFSDVWSKNARDMWESGSRKKIIPFIKEHIKVRGRICDLGCGEGYGSWRLSKEGFDVVGVDISNEMVIKASQKADGLDSLQFLHADIGNTPFKDEELDAVIAINSFEWTKSPLDTLNESRRILKPGGYGIIAILGPTAAPRKTHSYRRLYGEAVIMNSILPWEFERLALENGWSKIAEMGVEKKGADLERLSFLSTELKQALSFMWVFIFQKQDWPNNGC